MITVLYIWFLVDFIQEEKTKTGKTVTLLYFLFAVIPLAVVFDAALWWIELIMIFGIGFEWLKELPSKFQEKQRIRTMREQVFILLNDLHCNQDKEIQYNAIKSLVNMEDIDLSLLIMPRSEEYWENAARVLYLSELKESYDYVDDLFEWIKDFETPGATLIFRKLKLYYGDSEKLLKYIVNKYSEKADLENNEVWKHNINLLLEDNIFEDEVEI